MPYIPAHSMPTSSADATPPPKRATRHRQWKFSVEILLDWADAWHRAHRKWPAINDGIIPYADNADWGLVDRALRHGRYGLPPCPGGLPHFLANHRGAPLRQRARRSLRVEEVLNWAQHHHQRTGFWPSVKGARIFEPRRSKI